MEIFLTRESLISEENAAVHHIQKFIIGNMEYKTIYNIVLNYLPLDLSKCIWAGYIQNEPAVYVISKMNETEMSVKVILDDNWHKLLCENRTMHFKLQSFDKNTKNEIDMQEYSSYKLKDLQELYAESLLK